jgi:ArsR family transcriptional regulator
MSIAYNIDVCQYVLVSKITSCCPPVMRGTLSKAHAEDLAGLLKALADPMRLRLLSFIASQENGEACVCHVTEPVGLSQPTVSHHLKLLNDAGLLEREKRGTWVYYRIVPERLETIRAALQTRLPRAQTKKRA